MFTRLVKILNYIFLHNYFQWGDLNYPKDKKFQKKLVSNKPNSKQNLQQKVKMMSKYFCKLN